MFTLSLFFSIFHLVLLKVNSIFFSIFYFINPYPNLKPNPNPSKGRCGGGGARVGGAVAQCRPVAWRADRRVRRVARPRLLGRGASEGDLAEPP